MTNESGPIAPLLPRRAILGAGAFAMCAGVVGWRAALASDEHGPEWSYEGEEGPEHWGDLDEKWSECSTGNQQSPINIVSDQAEDKELPNVSTFYGVQERWVIELSHHTVRVTIDNGAYAMLNDEKWLLKQFHFHSPSEHARDGFHEAMELHMVHEAENDPNRLMVLGILLAVGEHNPELELVFTTMADLPRSAQQVHGPLELDFFLPYNAESFRYSGSLTTPPCTQGVQWVVYRESRQISEEQLNQFLAVQSENARPAREANEGEVEEDVSP